MPIEKSLNMPVMRAGFPPGFTTFADFFAQLDGEGEPMLPTAEDRRVLPRRLEQIDGSPHYLFEGVREDMLATAEVKECRRYPEGRMYVRYEVSAMLPDGSWDGPCELLSVWNADGRLDAYTFIHNTGRDMSVAATLHLAENEDGVGDEFVDDAESVLAFARDMKTGDAVVVGNDEINGEYMMVVMEKGGLRLCWQVFSGPWIFNSRSCVTFDRAEEAIRVFFDKGILGVEEFCEWEMAEDCDEESRMKAFQIPRELRRDLLRAQRIGDTMAERSLRDVGVTESGPLPEQDVRVPYGPYSAMLDALREKLDEGLGVDDYIRLQTFLALRGDELSQCDVAYHYEEGMSVYKKDFSAAEYWYLKAARQGNAMAQGNLGNMYRSVSQCRDAVYWLEKSAAQKLPGSMLSLADCLRCPRCSKTDIRRAETLEREGKRLQSRNYNPDPSRIRL